MNLSRRRFAQALALSPALSVLLLSPVGALMGALPRAAQAADSDAAGAAAKVPLAIHGAQGPTRLQVEIADEAEERNRGLMGRDYLPPNEGMLFLYAGAVRNGFWMRNTLIPLDIAFLDDDGRILEIQHMEPCPPAASECPTTQPAEAYRAALEVNAGTFEALGIRQGDCVTWEGSTGTCG